MRWTQKFRLRLRSLFDRRGLEQDLAEELRLHVEEQTAVNMRAGMSAAEARRCALAEFGGVERISEECRDARGVNWLENLWRDIHYGLRMMRKSPGFTAAAVLTLALGIGANAAIFSIVNAVLLRPLPFPDADRLVFLWATDEQRGVQEDVTSFPNFEDWRAQSKSFAAMAAFTTRRATLSDSEQAEMVPAIQGTPGIFELFGVPPALGRTFRTEEVEAGAPKVVILSDAFWKERFGGRTDVLGRTLRVNEEPRTVVGVMPPGFRISPEKPEQVYVPLVRDPNRGHGFLMVLGRLSPRASLRGAQTEMSVIARRLEEAYPKFDRRVGVNIVPLAHALAGSAKTGMAIFLGVVALVLLIACTNVANLMLSRGASRMKEIAVRAALGAQRSRIVQQLLVESTVLALGGGAAGLLLSSGMTRALIASLSRFDVPRLADSGIDARVLGFTLAISLLTGVFFGAVFAFSAGSPKVNETLRESSRSDSESVGGRRLRSVLIVAQAAMALVLLASAGVLLRSIFEMRSTAPGFRSDNMLVVDLWLPSKKFAQDSQRIQYFQNVLERAGAVHGVRSAALVADLPLGGGTDSESFHILGKPDPSPDKPFESLFNIASAGYFRTMGIPMRAGREFSETDSPSSAPVVVINETAARRFWAGDDPLGKQISLNGKDALTVIGVAGDTRQVSLGTAPRPEIYTTYMQPGEAWSWVVMVARTDGDPASFAATLKRMVQQVDADVPITAVRSMNEVLAQSLAQPQLFAGLLAVFASLALALAAVGLYGVVSYTVARRTHEIGVRMALGAGLNDVLSLVLKQGLGLTSAGVMIGMLGALGATRLLVRLVPNVQPGDPLTLALVSALLLAVAFAASYLPARRATRVDAVIALRYE